METPVALSIAPGEAISSVFSLYIVRRKAQTIMSGDAYNVMCERISYAFATLNNVSPEREPAPYCAIIARISKTVLIMVTTPTAIAPRPRRRTTPTNPSLC